MSKHNNKMGLSGLIGLIITTIVGAGIFNLSKEMASVSSVGGVILGWVITGFGMGTLAFSMQGLNELKPELHSGIFSYAREGFGDYIGFNSAWGYWFSTLIKNAAYGTLMFSALSYFFPIFEDGQNIASMIGASIVLWFIYWSVLRGTKRAERMNMIILVMKLMPIILFIISAIIAFKYSIFSQDIWGNLQSYHEIGGVFPQLKNTMLVTVFSFVGLESAIAFSGKAQYKQDVGKATVLGFSSVTLIYALVTVLSYGVMSREELSALPNPAMAYILEHMIGKVGAIIVNLGVVISIFGAWFSSTMLCEEVVYQSSNQGLFPDFFNQRNSKMVSVPSLTVSTILIQILFISFLLIPNAYSNLTKLSSATILISYTCIGLYYYKVLKKSDDIPKNKKWIAFLCTIYMLWLIYASGITFIALTILSLYPGTLMYMITRYKKNKRLFEPYEWWIFAILTLGLIYSITQIGVIFN